MDFFEISQKSLNFSALFILLSLLSYITFILLKKDFLSVLGLYLSLFAEILMTAGLSARWLEAGFSHPPVTNLYESMLSFCWGILFLFLVVEFKKRTNFLGILVISLVLTGMGLASLSDSKEIEPLVPALQSGWLHLHVITAIFGYGAFIVSAMFSLLFLFKSRIRFLYFELSALILSFFSLLALSVNSPLFSKGVYTMTAMKTPNGQNVVNKGAYLASNIERIQDLRLELPGMGIIFLLLIIACATLIFFNFYGLKKKFDPALSRFFKVFFGIFTLSMAVLLINICFFKPQLHENRTVSILFSSNPYELAIFLQAWIFMLIIFLFRLKEPFIFKILPDLNELENLSYRTILAGFPLLSLVIITGAIWAHYAWGRYWGWDPKETWSLITWLIYVLYFHVRFKRGWIGVPTSVISILGFVSVIFTYLGVNLLLSGLHSYGSG